MPQTSSIADRLGMDFDDLETGYNFDEDGEDYDQWTRFDREMLFDIVWDYAETYPPEIDDPVVEALIDDDDHRYHIVYDDQDRTTAVPGIALFAWADDGADVEVVEDGH